LGIIACSKGVQELAAEVRRGMKTERAQAESKSPDLRRRSIPAPTDLWVVLVSAEVERFLTRLGSSD
jgi:hypothetical protein